MLQATGNKAMMQAVEAVEQGIPVEEYAEEHGEQGLTQVKWVMQQYYSEEM